MRNVCPALMLFVYCVQVIGVWGDIGHTPNSTDTRNHLLANNPDIVYNTADFVYAGAGLLASRTGRHLPSTTPMPGTMVASCPVITVLVSSCFLPCVQWP